MREALKQGVEHFGRQIANDPDRVRGILGDLAPPATPEARAELELLVTAVSCGVPNDLLAGGAPQTDVAARLARDASVDLASATAAVDSWAYALGLPSRPAFAPPPPAPPAAPAPPPHVTLPTPPTTPAPLPPAPPTPVADGPFGPSAPWVGASAAGPGNVPAASGPKPKGNGGRVALIVAAVVAVVVVIGAAVVLLGGDEPAEAMACGPDDPTMCVPTDSETATKLRASCESGQKADCDELEMVSPDGSDTADFGRTCGGTTDGDARCTDGAQAADSVAAQDRAAGVPDGEAACVAYEVWKASTLEDIPPDGGSFADVIWRAEPDLENRFEAADDACDVDVRIEYTATEHAAALIPTGWTSEVDPEEDEEFSLFSPSDANIIVSVTPTDSSTTADYAAETRELLAGELGAFEETRFLESSPMGCKDGQHIRYSWIPDDRTSPVYQEQHYCVLPDTGLVLQVTATDTTPAGLTETAKAIEGISPR